MQSMQYKNVPEYTQSSSEGAWHSQIIVNNTLNSQMFHRPPAKRMKKKPPK